MKYSRQHPAVRKQDARYKEYARACSDDPMLETPPRQLFVSGPVSEAVPYWPVVFTGVAVTGMLGAGTVVYARRHNWTRSLICFALCSVSAYGTFRLAVSYK